MKIAIIKYKGGNTQSLLFALERLGYPAIVTDDHETIRSSDKVIFPGVGEASTAMRSLREKGLEKLIPTLSQHVLGICLGMQLLCRHSAENNTSCLGIFDLQVNRFDWRKQKSPQIGWNRINGLRTLLFKDIQENSFQYFVHGYYVETSMNTIAGTDYGIYYSSAINYNNFFGVQFHPEKSGKTGQQILKNFLDL